MLSHCLPTVLQELAHYPWSTDLHKGQSPSLITILAQQTPTTWDRAEQIQTNITLSILTFKMGHRGSKCSVDSHVVFTYDGAGAKPTGVCLKFHEFSTTTTETHQTQKKNPKIAKRRGKHRDAEKPGLVFVEDPIGGVWMKPRDIA